MADIHILTGDGRGSWVYVFHIPIADANNEVSISYRAALVNSGLGGSSLMTEGTGAGQISTAELAQIAAGELFEFSRGWLAESGSTTNAQMLVNLRAEHARVQPIVLAELQERLRYYGWSGSS